MFPLDFFFFFFRVTVKETEQDRNKRRDGGSRSDGSEKVSEEIRFRSDERNNPIRCVSSARAKVHLAYPGYSSGSPRPRRQGRGKESRVVVAMVGEGGRGGEQQDEGEGGGNPRREPSNLVPSRLEVCKNKREKRVRATCPGGRRADRRIPRD